MGIPGVTGFRFDMGKPASGWRIGNANQVLATWTLNLAATVARVTFQRLVTVGTIEFEFGCAHRLLPIMRIITEKSIRIIILFCRQLRMQD
jgi:hypothetical protein